LLREAGNKNLLKQIYSAFAQLGLGRQIEIIAKRREVK
ncbi:unnamed protein product, partial [marine sediment metagenome]